MYKEIFECVYLLEKDIFAIKSYFKGNIYTNIFIIKRGRNVLIIDTGVLSSFTKVKKVLEYVGYENIFIINTHSHWDHIGSNYNLKKEYNCLIIGHRNGSENFENLLQQWEMVFNKKNSTIKPTEANKRLFFKETNKGILPDILVSSDEIINIDNNPYKVIHTPGHSECSICIYDINSKYLYSGDLLSGDSSNNSVIIIDHDYERYISSINLIKELEIKKIFPSHFEVKEGEKVDVFINNSLSELFEYKSIIVNLIKDNRKISLIDLVNKFANVTGKKRSLYWIENSIRKIILYMIKNDIIKKDEDYYLLKEYHG